jgi:hypothetical protein
MEGQFTIMVPDQHYINLYYITKKIKNKKMQNKFHNDNTDFRN